MDCLSFNFKIYYLAWTDKQRSISCVQGGCAERRDASFFTPRVLEIAADLRASTLHPWSVGDFTAHVPPAIVK